jgi:hypothetical protein
MRNKTDPDRCLALLSRRREAVGHYIITVMEVARGEGGTGSTGSFDRSRSAASYGQLQLLYASFVHQPVVTTQLTRLASMPIIN